MNNANYNVQAIDIKTIFPLASYQSGTINTNGVYVYGTNTLFFKEMQVGSYLVDLAHNEFRKVISVESNTQAIIERPFSTEFVGATPNVISSALAFPVAINVIGVSGTNRIIDVNGERQNIPNGILIPFDKSSRSTSNQRDCIAPIFVEAADALVTILY